MKMPLLRQPSVKKLDIGASVKTLQGAWGEFYRAGYVTTKVYFRSKNPPKLTQNNDKIIVIFRFSEMCMYRKHPEKVQKNGIRKMMPFNLRGLRPFDNNPNKWYNEEK